MLYRDSQVNCHDIAYSTASSDTFIMNVSWYTHLPVVVRTIIAPAQHLNEDSTAPIAVTSVGSEERGVRRRNSSKSCWWKMAASASLQIWDRATETGRGTDRGLEHYQRALKSDATERHHVHTETHTECIIATDSTGNSPLAVSPDSITQSAPSSTALATSLPSALVGRRWVTMLSSICKCTKTHKDTHTIHFSYNQNVSIRYYKWISPMSPSKISHSESLYVNFCSFWQSDMGEHEDRR